MQLLQYAFIYLSIPSTFSRGVLMYMIEIISDVEVMYIITLSLNTTHRACVTPFDEDDEV